MEKKYLKYKNKYLKLKQKGGFELPNVIQKLIEEDYLINLPLKYHKKYIDIVKKNFIKNIKNKNNFHFTNNEDIEKYIETKYIRNNNKTKTTQKLNSILTSSLFDISDILINDLKIDNIDKYIDLLILSSHYKNLKFNNYNNTLFLEQQSSKENTNLTNKNINNIFSNIKDYFNSITDLDRKNINNILMNYSLHLIQNFIIIVDKYCNKNELIQLKKKLDDYDNVELKELSNKILIINSVKDLKLNNSLLTSNAGIIEILYYNINKPFESIKLNKLNIKYLYFGDNFNQYILENSLPESLTKLTFGIYFNNNIKPLGNAFSNLI